MKKLVSMALINFKEAAREKLFWGALFFFFLYLGFCIFLAVLSVGHFEKILRNWGLLGVELSALILIVFSFVFSFYRDASSRIKEIYLVNCGPKVYLSGKIAGFIMAAFVYLILSGAFFSGVLIWFKAFSWPVMAALYLMFLKIALMVIAVSFFCSIFSSAAIAILSSISLYFICALAPSALNIISVYGSTWMKDIAFTIYYLIPDLDKLDIRYLAAWGQWPSGGYLMGTTLYVLSYGAFLWLANILIFSQKEN
jgi:hypothetical protein